MNKVLFISLLFTGTVLCAQPTINSNVVPDIGTNSTFRFFNGQTYMPGDSGAGVTWDFSQVQHNATGIFLYKDPSTMSGGSAYPSANLGVDQNGNPLVYLLADNNQLSQIGSEFSGIMEDYSVNPKELMRFPISYGTMYTDSFEGSATVGTFNVNRKGDVEIRGDGYGTLILPYVTMNNVLRVRTVSNYEDKFMGSVVNSGSDTVYTWYVNGIDEYVYNWYHLTSTTVASAYHGAYLDTAFVGLDEKRMAKLDLNIGPNPTSDRIFISINKDLKEEIDLEVYDVRGTLMQNHKMGGEQRIHELEVDVSTFAGGSYFFVFRSGKGFLSESILVE